MLTESLFSIFKGLALGVDLSKDWNDNSIDDYSRWSGQFVVANIEMPKNSLITGFEIHAHTAGVVNLNVRTTLQSSIFLL